MAEICKAVMCLSSIKDLLLQYEERSRKVIASNGIILQDYVKELFGEEVDLGTTNAWAMKKIIDWDVFDFYNFSLWVLVNLGQPSAQNEAMRFFVDIITRCYLLSRKEK
jgi:hypothetical protein